MTDNLAYKVFLEHRGRTPSLEELAGHVKTLAWVLSGEGSFSDIGTLGEMFVSVITSKLSGGPVMGPGNRALNTAFQISQSAPALVFYTVELAVQAPLLSSQTAKVTMCVDANEEPTTVVGEATRISNHLVGLSVPMSDTTRQMLAGWVPAGNYVKLVSSGGGTSALVGELELIFG